VNAALTFIQKNPAQRVAVFVDVSNMYHSARNIYNSHLDFGAALKAAVGERQLVRAIAYAIKAESKDEEGFFNALTKQGFELKVKELQTFAGGAKKGDAVVLVSGDGDYSVLLEHIKTMGCRVEVMAFSESASHLLLKVADDFTDLSQNKKVFLRRIVRRR
jgi:uncharacterized LabA/DUF88 family protein